MNALKLVSTNDLSHNEWLEWRRGGIGGSDLSAICNMNRYRSPRAVYLDKIGQAPEFEGNEYTYWGTVLEDIVAKEFSIRTNLKVRRENKMLQHPKYSFMLANVDRLIVGQNAGLECKTANEYAKEDWQGESVPKEYALQCHHYMCVTGADRWYVAVLIGGNKFEWRVIERDDSIIRDIIEIESNFWNNFVLPRIPPAFGAHDESLLTQLYPQSISKKSMMLPEEAGDIIQAVYDSKIRIKEAEFDFENNKNKIKGYMGDSEMAWYDNVPVFSWKSGSKSRTFRILGGNE